MLHRGSLQETKDQADTKAIPVTEPVVKTHLAFCHGTVNCTSLAFGNWSMEVLPGMNEACNPIVFRNFDAPTVGDARAQCASALCSGSTYVYSVMDVTGLNCSVTS